MFEFNVILNDEDYLLFNQYHLLNSSTGKRSLTAFRLIIPLICFVFVAIFFIADADSKVIFAEAIAMAIISIIWIILSKKILFISQKRNIIKMKKESRLPYNKEAIIRFDDEHIYEITPKIENKTSYSLIEKIAVAEKAIYIYISSSQAHILPMTAFSEESEKLKFLEFINRKRNQN